MILEINDAKSVFELQDQFSTHYPFLKIDFYAPASLSKKLLPSAEKMSPHQLIKCARNIHNSGRLEVMSWFTVSRLEKEFINKFGLEIKVSKRENGRWVLSPTSCFCSLKEQNDRAFIAASSALPVKKRMRIKEYDCL